MQLTSATGLAHKPKQCTSNQENYIKQRWLSISSPLIHWSPLCLPCVPLGFVGVETLTVLLHHTGSHMCLKQGFGLA